MPGTMELVALLIGAVSMFALLEGIIRHTQVGTALVVLATALTTTFSILPDVMVGSTTIGIRDLVGTLMLVAAVARLLRSREASSVQWLLIAFGVLTLASVAQGVSEHGFNTAANEFRKYFGFLSVALYFSTVEPKRTLLDRIARAWFVLAGFLLFLALLRWLPLPSGSLFGALDAGTFRVLDADPTLVLVQAFIIGALAWARGEAPLWVRRLAPLLLAAVVLLQHRTVWAVLLATVATMFLLDRRAVRRLLPVTALGLVLIAVFSLALFDEEATDVHTQLAQSAAYRGTWQWRIEGWRVLIEQGPGDPAEVLVGQPFGGGWDRVMYGQVVSVSPHNFYVETYLRTGVLGLGLLVALYIIVLWRLARHRAGASFLGSRPLFLLLLSHPVFFIAYSPGPEQGLLLGLAVGTALNLGMEPDKTRRSMGVRETR